MSRLPKSKVILFLDDTDGQYKEWEEILKSHPEYEKKELIYLSSMLLEPIRPSQTE
jgi:hypothetical protein